MSFGEGNLRDEVERLRSLNGELCAEVNRQELAIRGLRALCRDLYAQILNAYDPKEVDEFADRMRELGV